MDILDATIYAITEARRWQTKEQLAQCAIVMHPSQHGWLCEHPKMIEASGPVPEGFCPRLIELEGMPIYIHPGLIGPVVVNHAILVLLRCGGARRVTTDVPA